MARESETAFVIHRQELLAWFAHQVRDAHLAQDLVQEVFVRFIEAAKAGPVQDARAYLFQMARNLLTDRARQQGVRKTTPVAPEELLDIEDAAPGPERWVDGRLRLRVLAGALQELPPLTQQIFIRVRVEDQSYQDVADALGISTSSVQKHLARALAHVMLRAKLS